MRFAISARIRLCIALRFIATRDSYRSLEFLSRVSRKTISKIVPEVLGAIYDALQISYLKSPQTENEWLEIATDFQTIWDFPHTLGAIDGKHIRIKAPTKSGSDYNYKGYFSIVLLAAVDAHSKFIYIDVGGNGRASDVIIYKNCSLKKALDTGHLNIPTPAPLPGQQKKTPYFFIGDDIFGLDKNLMKGFGRSSRLTIPEEVFNYRLSRARLTVEMTFGRMASRFRIFHCPIELSLDKCESVVKACAVLHNYLAPNVTKATEQELELLPKTESFCLII